MSTYLMFISPSYEDVTITGERLQIFNYARHSLTIEQ